MAAVAGAVADEMLAALTAARSLETAYVNNGGDIAVHLAPGAALDLGVVARLDSPAIDATARLTHDMPVRGIATSGWRGRSLSLGIADSVTVLAETAAAADVAATLIANAVDVDSPAVARTPARDLDPDSDLGDRPVTVGVGDLTTAEIETALAAGRSAAQAMIGRRLIAGAALVLCGRNAVAGGATLPAIADGGPVVYRREDRARAA